MLLCFVEVDELESRMLVHRTRQLVVCHGEVECGENAKERVLVTASLVRAENIATRLDALMVLFAEEKALYVQKFVRVGFEGGHAFWRMEMGVREEHRVCDIISPS
jgi:hypothetical protein